VLDEVAGPDILDMLCDSAAEDHLPQSCRNNVVLDGDVVFREGGLGADHVLDPREEVRQPGVEVELAAELAENGVAEAGETSGADVGQDVVEIDRVLRDEISTVIAVELGQRVYLRPEFVGVNAVAPK
jgi:hypothetical protein